MVIGVEATGARAAILAARHRSSCAPLAAPGRSVHTEHPLLARGTMSQAIDQLQATFAGRYTVERELARGGMATVYLARDIRHDRRVAIKVFRSALAAEVAGERFR